MNRYQILPEVDMLSLTVDEAVKQGNSVSIDSHKTRLLQLDLQKLSLIISHYEEIIASLIKGED